MATRQIDTCTVLVADGEKPDRALISALLERIGCVTHQAATGVEALALAQTVRPDAFVLAVELPETSGYEVCHELRAEFGDQVPIVLVSATRMSTLDRVAAFLIGADEVRDEAVRAGRAPRASPITAPAEERSSCKRSHEPQRGGVVDTA